MKRRTFIKSLLGAGLLGGGLWTFLEKRELWGMLSSALSPGSKKVDNFRTTPPFDIRSFAAEPSVRFMAIGDWGTGGKLQRRIAARMSALALSEKPQFIMSTGDNIYPDGVDSAGDSQWAAKFEKPYADPALQLPWYAVLGNHDYHNDPDAQVAYTHKSKRWNMPARHYSYSMPIDAANSVDFFALDTQLINTGNRESTASQCAWLDKALAQSTARWKVVFGHHMLRSHGVYGDQARMLKSIKPILDRHKVDIYINGHDHDLQLLKAQEDSFYCLISGAGGGARHTAYGKNSIFAATNGGFSYIALTRNELYVQFIDSEGTPLYAHTIPKSA